MPVQPEIGCDNGAFASGHRPSRCGSLKHIYPIEMGIELFSDKVWKKRLLNLCLQLDI